MAQKNNVWTPSRDSALASLAEFLPRAGRAYAETRNEDRGPADRSNVSGLSPWIRTRMLTEPEVVSAVLAHHSFAAAEKFIQEVCWRTYWKGWLETRPAIWREYLNDLRNTRMDADPGYRRAVEGRTGIDCFDAFVKELVETGYLHNHARMWFASIWIFTLRLPWVLGADFFLRHLLDGDPASNTLSWRWVGGLQTAGKCYVATAENIQRFTAGRFRVGPALATPPPPVTQHIPFPHPLSLPARAEPVPNGPVGLLVGEDDLSAPRWLGRSIRFASIAGLVPATSYASSQIDAKVLRFREQALAACLASDDAGITDRTVLVDERSNVSSILEWALGRDLRAVVMAEPPVGLWDHLKVELERGLSKAGVQLIYRRHPWDEAFYPHATRGFFHLKSKIPELLKNLVGSECEPR